MCLLFLGLCGLPLRLLGALPYLNCRARGSIIMGSQHQALHNLSPLVHKQRYMTLQQALRRAVCQHRGEIERQMPSAR
jgi:hypothetical protein